jgi:Protein of unknown function (DUF3567)
MQMLYNSENFAVVQIELSTDHSDASPLMPVSTGGESSTRGGYEIVDKFARKEIFLQGALADTFKQGVDELIQTGPSEEEIDAYIERYAALMQHSLRFH